MVMTRILAKSLYGLFAAVYLVAGVAVLLAGTGRLPGWVVNVLTDVSRGDANALHIMQELGTHLILAGLVAVWFFRHYELSRSFHWAMTACWGLFALIHWCDIRGPIQSVVGPAANSIPFALF